MKQAKHVAWCVGFALLHPRIALLGAREFRNWDGVTYGDWRKSEAYDAGRELAHIITLRRFEQY